MKKVFSIIVLAGCIAGMTPAQDEEGLKITGVVKTGIQVQSDTNDTGMKFYSDDVGDDKGNNNGYLYRADLNAAYNAGVWGAVVGLRAEDGYTAAGHTPTVSLREAFGYVTLFNNGITIKAGKIDSAVWNTAGIQDRNLSNGLGGRIEITPVSGLNFGAAFFGHEGENNTLGDYFNPADAYSNLGESVRPLLKAAVLGLSYDNDKIYAAVSYRPEGKSKGTIDFAAAGAQSRNFITQNQVIFGLKIKAIENFKLNMEVLFADGFYDEEKMTAASKEKRHATTYGKEINADIGYTFGALGVGAELYAYPYTTSKAFDFSVEPYVGYAAAENHNVGLKLYFDNLLTTKDDKAAMEIGIKPNYTWKLGENSKLVIFDKVAFKPAHSDSLKNTVQVDFVWAF